MREAVYNSAIPKAILKSVKRGGGCKSVAQLLRFIFAVAILSLTIFAHAADWNAAEQQLARKIVAITGPGAVALTVENRSTLARRESEAVQNGLRYALEQLGIRFVDTDQAAASVAISLSENPTSYVWVAQIRQGESDAAVAMVSVPRPGGAPAVHDSMPMALRRTLLWTQDDPILDVAVLEEGATPTRIVVLDPAKVSLYRWQNSKWQAEQVMEIPHSRPWPRDLRGRLIAVKDHLLDVYLPGVSCHSAGGNLLSLNCRDSEDPSPLVANEIHENPSASGGGTAAAVIPAQSAFFAPTRNFFTGVMSPGLGKGATVPSFYSAAALPRGKYTLWLFAATDGQVHMVDGMSDRIARLEWGSDLVMVKTSCGAGWQVLSTSSGGHSGDAVRAYEIPDRDPVAASAAADFAGKITALWTESRGDTAIAVMNDPETGSYEAFRLAVACDQ
ncbi:MAG: hypothetical protein WCF26_02105 [Candidatus Sulfotelmatobacter sp.]